jgi:hypothetical protein
MSFTYYFKGRKPQYRTVARLIKQAVELGHEEIHLIYGENWIEMFRDRQSNWVGEGWIKEISGHNLAQEINYS